MIGRMTSLPNLYVIKVSVVVGVTGGRRAADVTTQRRGRAYLYTYTLITTLSRLYLAWYRSLPTVPRSDYLLLRNRT